MLPTSDPDIDISSQRVDILSCDLYQITVDGYYLGHIRVNDSGTIQIQTSNGQTGKSFPPSESLEDAVTTLAEYLRTLPR